MSDRTDYKDMANTVIRSIGQMRLTLDALQADNVRLRKQVRDLAADNGVEAPPVYQRPVSARSLNKKFVIEPYPASDPRCMATLRAVISVTALGQRPTAIRLAHWTKHPESTTNKCTRDMIEAGHILAVPPGEGYLKLSRSGKALLQAEIEDLHKSRGASE